MKNNIYLITNLIFMPIISTLKYHVPGLGELKADFFENSSKAYNLLKENDLPRGKPVFVYDYPEELAALAKVENGRAKRFEIYWNGVELGNAFFELTSPDLQMKRFKEEQEKRIALGKEAFEIDPNFIRSLESGLPSCSGIAMGLDRLLMITLKQENLKTISPYYRMDLD